MQILPGPGFAQPTPLAAPQSFVVAGPTSPAAPMQPARRGAANRESAGGDLLGQEQAQRTLHLAQRHGQLIDLLV
jgi:hypothetical protein